MEDFVSPQKQTFEMQGGKEMIYFSYSLRHPHVVRVFRLELEFENGPVSNTGKVCPAPCDTPISRDPQQLPVAVSNYSQGVLVGRKRRFGCAEYRSNQIIVKKWRAQRQLCLFQREYAVMIPRALF